MDEWINKAWRAHTTHTTHTHTHTHALMRARAHPHTQWNTTQT